MNIKTNLLAAALLALTSVAHADLIDRGNGMIYDTKRDITWLADMNYAKTSGYDTDGRMTWLAAKAWADSLQYGGYSDWALPTITQLSGLFVTDLGNKPNQSILNQIGDTPQQMANFALFKNVQISNYWSGSEYTPNSGSAWYFNTRFGYQGDGVTVNSMNALAMRPGDVASPVPEPAIYSLMMLGLGAVGFAARRRKA